MIRRIVFLLVLCALAAGGGAAFFIYRRVSPPRPPAVAPIPVARAPTAPARASTIIDLPGDPALIRRSSANAPHPIALAVPLSLAAGAPKDRLDAFFVSEPLTPAGGGDIFKFTDNGQQADALNAEIAMNAAQAAGASDDAGDDDDGGDATLANAPNATPLTAANSIQLDTFEGGENGRPQLKEVTLRPSVTQKISQLLIDSGFEPTGAEAAEAAAKRLYNIQSLGSGAAALAVGAVDASGAYRAAQLAIFEDGEYVGTVALAENGLYGEGAEPALPPGFLDKSARPPAGVRFTLADGAYSAGLRSAAPEPVIRDAVRLMAALADLNAPLPQGETLKLIYTLKARAKDRPESRIVYAGLSGGATSVECYAFLMSDGGFRCYSDKGEAAAPLPPEREGAGGGALADSGAAAVGGLLAPIRGAPITSLFGMRFHPILHIERLHAGIDFGAPVGSQIRAAADGEVESAGEARGYGERVVLKHAGYETTYNHLSKIMAAVGQKVKQGDIIALSGNSGLSTGPHLHFEYRVNGVPADPLPHMGKEVQAHAPVGAAGVRPVGPPPRASDPATAAAFAAAKPLIDAAIADAQR